MKTEKVNQFEVQYMTIKEYNDIRNTGKVNSDTAYQRGLTSKWLTPVYRGTWLDSIMRGRSIGSIMVNLTGDGTYELIDGKQRSNAIFTTIDNLIGFEGLEDDNLNHTMVNWTEDNRNAFMSYVLTFIVYEGLDEAECREIFERTNGGIQLGAYELRRGKLVKIISNPMFLSMVESLTPLMLRQSKMSTRTGAEEVLLQALSNIAFNNHDYTAKKYVEILQTLPVADYDKNLQILSDNVSNVIELLNPDDEDNFSQTKWVLRKSVLNCLLTISAKEFNPLNFGSFPKTASDKQAGSDQIEFKKYNSNGTASEVNVKGRISILEKIQSGSFTKNIAGERKESTPKPPKTTKIELTPLSVSRQQVTQAKYIWRTEDEDFVKTSLGMVLAWCEALKVKYVAPVFTAKSGKLSFEYRDNDQKSHFKPLTDIDSTVTVKIESEAEVVTA
jgi:hypothetical protein